MVCTIEISNLTKIFKGKKAVDDVSFTVSEGEVVALLGPNGAGKSTTMHMMLGLLEPSAGTAKLFGLEPNDRRVRERIGVMPQHINLIDALKVKELISLFRNYYANPLSLEELVGITGLTGNELSKRTDKLSGGQKRQVGFMLSLAGNPDVLFFDEPTVGMDSTVRKKFWKKVKELSAEGKTILFSTHYLQEADDIATRIILFNKGKVIADGSPEEIKINHLQQTVSFRAKESIHEGQLDKLPNVKAVNVVNGSYSILTDNADAVLAELFAMKIGIKDIGIKRGSLDDVFEQLTDKEGVS